MSGSVSEIDTTKVIAKNIAELRKEKGMTQAALAEQLGYSDKSISKWERAEGLPDILCMKKLADLFGVTVDYFFEKEHSGEAEYRTPASADIGGEREKYVTNHRAVVLVAAAGVWTLAAIVHIILYLCGIETYIPLISALPVTALLCVIFAAMWKPSMGGRRGMFLSVTFLVWSILLLVCYAAREHDLWLVMILGIPASVIVWLSCRIKKKVEPAEKDEN